MTLKDSLWPSSESSSVVKRYESLLRKHGYGEEALGWGKKGRQQLRFSVLASHWDLRGKTVLDLGAGFGDFYAFTKHLRLQKYIGIDLTPGIVSAGNERYGCEAGFQLKLGSATDESLFQPCDVSVISGLFNFRLKSGRNREFIGTVLQLAFKYSRLGVACNFITDRVDYRDPLIHYQSPSEALEMAYGFTRNVTLEQDYMPFEFTVFLDKRQEFDADDGIFKHITGSA